MTTAISSMRSWKSIREAAGIEGLTLKRMYSLLAAVLGTALAVSVFIPWFELPILGLSVPTPAWNKGGVACLVLASILYLRALGGFPLRWLVRLTVLPTAYFWWQSVEQMKSWGVKNLAPAQLKLSTVNSAMTKLGAERVTLYEPSLWKSLEPSYGWKAAGFLLLVTAVVTVLDGPRIRKCQSCGQKGRGGDSFCFQCGMALTDARLCGNCGGALQAGDSFCRHCAASAPKP